MNAPTFDCPRCQGDGRRELDGPDLRAYRAIVKLGNPTVPEIFAALREKVGVTTINHRVARLVGWKLVKVDKESGFVKRYSAV